MDGNHLSNPVSSNCSKKEEETSNSSNEDEHSKQAQEFKTSGNDKFNKSNYKGAVIEYQKGLLHEPNNPDLHANLSAAYIHLEKYLDAEEHAVYTIHLKPTFYKGYMRAAKAAHARGMTTLALKRISNGLAMVTDLHGVKELNRLKTQYTSYLSLKRNADQEIELNSDTYVSEDDHDWSSGEQDDDNNDFLRVACKHKCRLSVHCTQCEKEDSDYVEQPDEVSNAVKPERSSNRVNESLKTETVQVQEKEAFLTETQQQKCQNHTEGEVKVAEASETAKEKSTENDLPLDKNDSSQERKDGFLELCRELTRDPNLTENVKEFMESLKNGSEALLGGNYSKAVECYKTAYQRVGSRLSDYGIDDRQLHVIKYAQCVALVNLGSYDDIVKAVQILTDMEIYKFSIPALYLQLARAYIKLNRFKPAMESLEKVQEIIDQCVIFPSFAWPNTSEVISDTTPSGLKDAHKELNQICRVPYKPTAICRYDQCLKTSTHIVPSEFINMSDPDFVGFVRMMCEEKCHIEFHIACWKSYKESISGIGKVHDKDILGHHCLTMDCVNAEGNTSLITVIEIIGADGLVKSVNKLDPKAVVASKKKKKKKCKLDDKDIVKAVKPKKTKEKKVQEVKKPVVEVVDIVEIVEDLEDGFEDVEFADGDEDEDETDDEYHLCGDTELDLEPRLEHLIHLRTVKVKAWDPRFPYYSQQIEMEKWIDKCESDGSQSKVQFIDYSNEESIDVKDAKEFIFSYFVEVLKVEGPQKMEDIEDLWKQTADDYCNIQVVLPNLKCMTDLLLQSKCFCKLEDYICLASQTDVAYKMAQDESISAVAFLLSEYESNKTSEPTDQPQLPDLLNHSNTKEMNQIASQSSSDDEATESQDEYNSEGSESEETDGETSEDDENPKNVPLKEFEEKVKPPLEEFSTPKIKEMDGDKFSLQDILEEMSRVKKMFMKTTSEDALQTDNKEPQSDQSISTSNDTFETAHGSSQFSCENDKDKSYYSSEEGQINVVHDDEIIESEKTVVCETQVLAGSSDNIINSDTHVSDADDAEKLTVTDKQMVTDSPVCNKGSQSEVVTEEQQIQTVPLDTKNAWSQTDCDTHREMNEKVQQLTQQLSALTEENQRLAKEVVNKELLNKEIKEAQNKAVAHLQEENEKIELKYQERLKKMEEDYKKLETESRKKEEKMVNEVIKAKEHGFTLMQDQKLLINDLTLFNKQKKELEENLQTLEKNMKTKIISSQKAQLHTTREFWQSQVKLLGKRCVEKMSEMHNWFSLLPPGLVQELPSWKDVQQITMQWREVSSKIQQIQADFQVKCLDVEKRLSQGEEIDDMDSLSLPVLPDEPDPLPLDKIHEEITDKYTKRINQLTQLVANQQLEIEQIKKNFEKVVSGTFEITPRIQTPLTTAFGSLALQYPFPQNQTSQFGSTNIATVPTLPPNPDMSKVVGSKPLQTDVQTLFKETTTATPLYSNGINAPVVKFQMAANSSTFPSSTDLKNASFLKMPPPPPPSFVAPPPLASFPPPPPKGVAQNLLKSSSTQPDNKDKKPVEQLKAGSSRESTPVPASTPNPTPEKSKKKKKNKAGSKDEEVKDTCSNVDAKEELVGEDSDTTPWSVCINKKAIVKPTVVVPTVTPDTKMKNHKRLLDKLQLKFPTMTVKELDEVVKLVRDQNNGSLSGLPFQEIETRVERFIMKKTIQKSSTLGLSKFTDVVWGVVKQQKATTWANIQLEECTICLETMGDDRTKVDCNHEFHTKCLRKWLKEKSVCPLCNKFTTMPDEFPAL